MPISQNATADPRGRTRAGSRRRRNAMVAVAASLFMVLGLAPAVAVAAPKPAAPAAPAAQSAPPTEAKVVNTYWYSDRRVALWIYSPAMKTNVQVQLLLGRDWNAKPTASFPQLLVLDGLRAREDQSGWTINTDIEKFFKDKNVNVIMPVGGMSSFYTNWQQPDQGRNYQYETFLTKELPPIMEGQWRSTNVRGVEGLSMGGSAAMMLAARFPGFYKFAGSFSGFLQLSTFGMPQAVQFAMKDAGGFDSNKMFGAPTDPAWKDHDPFMLASKLRGTSLYISSGNGMVGKYDSVSSIPGLATNYAGVGLELLARTTSQQFATKLNQLGVPAQAVYRESGTHTWPYWQFEMKQSWPQAANALGLANDKVACKVGGPIGAKARSLKLLGGCITPEYAVPGGRAQDFRDGRILWSQKTGAHVISGSIGGAYVASGSSAGYLGFPTSDEKPSRTKGAKFNEFQNGAIYWSRKTGAHAVGGKIYQDWAKNGFAGGPMGLPTGDEVSTPGGNGRVQGFQIGAYLWSPKTGAHSVQGRIFDRYRQLGSEGSFLGFPTSNEINLRRGKLSNFSGGKIYWSATTGARAIPEGPILKSWGDKGFENGRFGYPTSDQFPIPGGAQVNFERGAIKFVNGTIILVGR